MSTIKVTVGGSEYAAEVEGGRVRISRDGVWAGDGRWAEGAIQDCPAVLGDDVYDALDEAIADELA